MRLEPWSGHHCIEQGSSNWGSRDFKFWIFRDYDNFGRKVAKYKINSKRRPFFFFRKPLDFGGKIAESEIYSR